MADRPGGAAARSYRFPVRFVAAWLGSTVLGRRRPLGRDAEWLHASSGARAEGLEHVPDSAPYVIVMNHYERPGLGVWWPALLVAREIHAARVGAPELTWLVTDRFYRFRLFGMPLPERVVSWALGRVAARYGLLQIARRRQQEMARALALRRAGRLLAARGIVASTPEGARGEGRTLHPPISTSGMSLAWLSRGHVPILPAAVFEDGEGLVVRFGPVFTLDWYGLRVARERRAELAELTMRHIARLMPPDLRGPFIDEEAGGAGPA